MPSLYRMWAKARRGDAVAWEQEHPRGYFASTAGSSPIDAVWAQAARQEAGAANGEVAGMVLEDLASFYETIDRNLLAQEADALNFPQEIIRASLAAYGAPRMIALHGRLAKEVPPRKGVVAGCAFATTYVKVVMQRALGRAAKDFPDSVALDTYIDDIALSAVGEPKAVERDLLAAHRILRKTLREELGCTFASEKTAVVATNRELTRKLRDGIRGQGYGRRCGAESWDRRRGGEAKEQNG